TTARQTPSPGDAGRGRGLKPGAGGDKPPGESPFGAQLKAVPLKFVKELKDIVLQEAESIGSSAVFECQISPSTAITTWMKDGSNLRESPKHKFTSDGKDRKLQIIDVQLSDTGEYTCVAKLGNKEKTSTAKLIVEGRGLIMSKNCEYTRTANVLNLRVEQRQGCCLEERRKRAQANCWQNSNQCYWIAALCDNPRLRGHQDTSQCQSHWYAYGNLYGYLY
uniref:Ig-like domain-containing protein n=1 Tax=Cyprinus carpio TaxID=7962 RepID=A0A8C1MV77_CYPCA